LVVLAGLRQCRGIAGEQQKESRIIEIPMKKPLVHQRLLQIACGALLLAAFSARADYFNTVMSLRPVGYWPLNETTPPGPGVTTATNLGSLGSAFNAAFQGNVTFGVPGPLAGGTDIADGFDGSTAQAQTPYGAALGNAPSFTVEAWLLSHAPSGGTQCALADVDSNNPRSGWLLYMDGNNAGQYNFRTYNQNGNTASLNLNIGAAGSINADQWYHVVIVVSNAVTATNVYAYVNGALAVGPTALTAFVPSDGAVGGFTIGARNDGGFRFVGAVGEVAYYSTALAGTTIAAHYTAGTNASPPTPYAQLVQQSNPILYFRLNEANNLPVAHNYGSLGSAANGYYQAGTVPGVPGPTFSGLANGFGANDFACQFSPAGAQSSTSPGPGVACDPYSLGILDDQTTITLAAWVKVPATSVGWFTGVLGRGDSSYRFGLDQGGLPRFADGGGGNGDVTGSTAVNDGKWHLWTGVYNAANSNAYLYIDTTLAGSAVWNPPGGTSTREFFIGGAPDYTGRNFVGNICQVAIITNALTVAQVKQLYYSAAPSQFAQAVASLGPVAYWPLNETNQPPVEPNPVPAANSGTLGTDGNAPFSGDIVHGYPGALAGDTDSADSFNGFVGKAQAPYTAPLSTAPSFTIETWMKPHDDGTLWGITCLLSSVDANSPRSGWLIYQNVNNASSSIGQLTFRTYAQSGSAASLSLNLGAPGSIQSEKWYHVAVVVSNAVTVTNVYGYINGVLVAGPVALPAYVPNDGAQGGFTIAGRTDQDGYDYTGVLDEVAYYTNALSGNAILAHYQAGTNPSPATAYSALVLQQHPLLYYRMNEVPALAGPALVPLPVAANAGSLGALANGFYQPGTVPGVAGPTNVGFGLTSLACQFSPDGAPSTTTAGPGVICAPYAQAALNFNQALTLAAWVQVPSVPVWFQTVVGRGDASYRLDVDPTVNGGKPHFAANPNGDVVGPNPLYDDQWHFWAGVFDPVAKASYLYIDGLLAAQASGSPLANLTCYLLIGGAPDYTGRNFVGNVCQVSLFTNALSAGQIESMYNAVGTAPQAFLPTNAITLNQGANGSVSAAVSGTPPLTFQWYYIDASGNTNIATGQTSATLGFTNVQAAVSGNQYFLTVNNAYGSAVSSAVTVTVVQGPPQIQVDIVPLDAIVPVGVSVTYSVAVTGTQPFHYQWYLNGTTPIAGATNTSYSAVAQLGTNTYSVTITNAFGPANSAIATLIGVAFTSPPPVVSLNTNGTGWTLNGNVTNAAIATNVLTLTDGSNGEIESAFFNTPQFISSFVALFTYQEANGSAPLADGTTFCIQNSPAGATALGGGGGELAYYGITPSAAFEMNIYNGSPGGIGFQFGANGSTPASPAPTPTYMPTTPLNLASDHPINVRIVVNNGLANVLLVDATTGDSYTASHDFGSLVANFGGGSAYVGFTAATGGLNSIQTISNFRFSYTSTPVLSVSKSGSTITVSWPVSVATLFVLQHSASLAGPWTNVATSPALVNGQNQVSVTSTGAPQFYRLVLQ
jgi:hypothetical protein